MAGDDRKVVADEDQRGLRFGAKPIDQGENARLHGDVERRGRLVGDHELRAAADRHGDQRPLPFTPGEAERIALRGALGVGDADMLEQAHRLGVSRPAVQAAMQDERLGDLGADAAQRVQRRHRLLEHHGDPVAAQAAHRLLVEPDHLARLEAD